MLRISIRLQRNSWTKIILPVSTVVQIKISIRITFYHRKSRMLWEDKGILKRQSEICLIHLEVCYLLVSTLSPPFFLEKSPPTVTPSDSSNYTVCSQCTTCKDSLVMDLLHIYPFLQVRFWACCFLGLWNFFLSP